MMGLRWVALLLGCLFVVAVAVPGRAYSSSDYPLRMQLQLNSALGQYNTKKMQQVFALYEQQLKNGVNEFVAVAQKAGFHRQELDVLRTYAQNSVAGSTQLTATFDSGVIRLRDESNELTIKSVGFGAVEFLVNGKAFAWNLKETASENLKRYDLLFRSSSSVVLQQVYDFLIPNAFSAQPFRMKAAGLYLYFSISVIGEAGDELYQLNSQVKKMIQLCEVPGSDSGDAFVSEVMRGSLATQSDSHFVHLKNCGSIKDYASRPSGNLRNIHKEIDAVNVYPNVPVDLCDNLDRLARCVHGVMDSPVSVSEKKKKSVEKKDSEEWLTSPRKIEQAK